MNALLSAPRSYANPEKLTASHATEITHKYFDYVTVFSGRTDAPEVTTTVTLLRMRAEG